MPPDLDVVRRAAARLFYRKADLDVPDQLLHDLRARRRTFARLTAGAVAREAERVLGLRRATAVPRDAGTLHAVYVVSDADGPRCFARTGLPGLPEPAGELAVDRTASRAASTAGIPTPAVLHVDLTRSHVPFDLELLAIAEGEPLAPDAAGDAARRDLGRTLAGLHRVTGEGWGLLDPTSDTPRGLHASWTEYVHVNLDAHLSGCAADGSLASSEIDAVAAAFREAAPALRDAPRALCHGDLGAPNVLTNAGTITALLDWEDALIGDPIFDLAGWGTFIGHHERRGTLLAGYAERAPLPDDFEVRYWIYAVRILLAKTVHRRRFGYAATDRIPAGDRLRPAIAALAAALGRGA